MDPRVTEISEDAAAETPEDVAILYSWANLHEAKYHDFSASRREHRAQVRHRAAEELRITELQAKEKAESAARQAERVVREAERAVKTSDSFDDAHGRERALREAEDAARRAAAERVEAARRAEAAAMAEAVARREEREVAEAHASAQRQARSHTHSEIRRRALAGSQPTGPESIRPAAEIADPYEAPVHPGFDTDRNHPVQHIDLDARMRLREELPVRVPHERRRAKPDAEPRHRPEGFRPDEASGVFPAFSTNAAPERPPVTLRTRATDTPMEIRRTAAAYAGTEPAMPLPAEAPISRSQAYRDAPRAAGGAAEPQRALSQRPAAHGFGPHEPEGSPAWLYSSGVTQPRAKAAPVADTLQHSQERVASRWFALKGVFDPATEGSGSSPAEASAARGQEVRPPALAVFSLAGGVGKTSLVATLGRALSALGEKVLVADTTSHGLMPFYFGASELRAGVVRTFSPPAGSTDAPIHLVSYEVDRHAQAEARNEALVEELLRSSSGTNRMLLDLNASSGWVARRLTRLSLTVLVPLAPDMNSVITLETIERYFEGVQSPEGRPVLPYYLLSGFDASQALHLDVREVLRGKLGERLLPSAVRRSPAVSEALAEGMTVIDYAPDASITGDYRKLAGWLRGISPPATQALRNTRWSER